MDAHHVPHHSHLWHLPDGTGLHAPLGVIQVEEATGRLCCHLCGNWFRSLGSHVGVHGHTADSYRAELGLCRGEPLIRRELSAAISARQKAAYGSSDVVRERLAAGQELARSGALSTVAVQARSDNPLPAEALARQARALAAGRRTVAGQREAALRSVLEDSGCPDLPSYLRLRYGRGASLADLAAETGLGRDRLRREIAAAGVGVRGPGQNTPAGRRSRARTAEAAAAKRVGADDLLTWLSERRRQGWTLAALGAAVGHSGHWVSWRLPRLDSD